MLPNLQLPTNSAWANPRDMGKIRQKIAEAKPAAGYLAGFTLLASSRVPRGQILIQTAEGLKVIEIVSGEQMLAEYTARVKSLEDLGFIFDAPRMRYCYGRIILTIEAVESMTDAQFFEVYWRYRNYIKGRG